MTLNQDVATEVKSGTSDHGAPTMRPSAAKTQLAIFDMSPLLEGENPEAYKELFEQIAAAVKPKDIFEWLWVREIADLVWDIFRLGRLKKELLAFVLEETASKLILPVVMDEVEDEGGLQKLDELLHTSRGNWSNENPECQPFFERWRSIAARVNLKGVGARSFLGELENVERMDCLVAIAQARWNNILREINHHRHNFGAMLRNKRYEIEDAEFDPTEPDAASSINSKGVNTA